MKCRWFSGLVFCALMHAGGNARAESGAPVRVYTNADIERLAPLPTQRAPLVGFDKERWEYVIQFLEREFQRLDVDRNHQLAREILRAEVEASRQERPRYVMALAPYQGFHRRPHRDGRRDRRRGAGSFKTPVGERIVPLHARPSQARLHFDRATGRASN